MARLKSSDLTIGKHIYFAEGAKGTKKHFKEGVVKERYKKFAVIETKSTFPGSFQTYNLCLNYTDIDGPDDLCVVQDSIAKDEYETQADLVVDME